MQRAINRTCEHSDNQLINEWPIVKRCFSIKSTPPGSHRSVLSNFHFLPWPKMRNTHLTAAWWRRHWLPLLVKFQDMFLVQQATATRQQGLAQCAVFGHSLTTVPIPSRIVCAFLDVGDARCCICLFHCRFHINMELVALKALKYNPSFQSHWSNSTELPPFFIIFTVGF